MQRLTVLLTAAALTAAVAGCTTAEQAALEKFCADNGIADCEIFTRKSTDPGSAIGVPPEVEQPIAATALAPSAAPADLRTWAETQRTAEESASKVITEGSYTYIGVAGGMQRTGGYRIEIVNVAKQDGGYLVEAKVIAPGPDEMVTMALQNPIAFFQLQKLEGNVEVRVLAPAADEAAEGGDGAAIKPPVNERVTVSAVWAEAERVEVTGKALIADIHFEVMLGDAVLAQADAQVKENAYIANLLVAGGVKPGMVLVVSNPDGGEVLDRIPLDTENRGGVIAEDEVWSDNFRVNKPLQVAADLVLVEGAARAFEATFKVEIWADDKKVAEDWVMAMDGAPNFGRFSHRIKVEGGVPSGAEARFILESAKDGSETVELTVPVVPQS